MRPGSPEWRDRLDANLLEEAQRPLAWWWLSFADPGRPAGTQFQGVAVVEARGVVSACTEASQRGINPGGEVRALEIPPEHVPPEEYRNRLLSKAELETAGLA